MDEVIYNFGDLGRTDSLCPQASTYSPRTVSKKPSFYLQNPPGRAVLCGVEVDMDITDHHFIGLDDNVLNQHISILLDGLKNYYQSVKPILQIHVKEYIPKCCDSVEVAITTNIFPNTLFHLSCF
jgi:hypothetical protein